MRRRSSGAAKPLRPWRGGIEPLEERTCLSVAVQLDYSQDALGFFSDQSRRSLLQRAADTIASRFDDSLRAIAPSGSNTWTATATNPATGAKLSISNLAVPANTLIVYAGGRPMSGSTLGIGGPGGYSGSGSQSWLNLLEGRGQTGAVATPATDQGPWGGSITFDSDTSWYFGLDPAGLRSSQADFFSVALHELGHVFGFGMSVWDSLVSGGAFQGPASIAAYARGGKAPPVSGQHWAQGLTSDSQEVAMDPTITLGHRKLFTALDFAAFKDIGWQVTGDGDATRAGARDAALAAGSTRTFDAETLDRATDIDLFRFTASRQDTLNIGTFAVPGGTAVDTYLRLLDSSGAELAAANNGTFDTLSYTFTADGTYYLGVSSPPNRYYTGAASPSRLVAGPTGAYTLVLGLNQEIGAPTTPPVEPTPTPTPQPNPTPAPTPTPAPVATPDTTAPFVLGAEVRSVSVRPNPRSRPQRVTVIFVYLSEALDAAAASSPGSYRLITGRRVRGRGLVFDRRAGIQRVSYIPGASGLMLFPARGFSARQPHLLVIPQSSGLKDTAGNLLDGDRDGLPGGDFGTRV